MRPAEWPAGEPLLAVPTPTLPATPPPNSECLPAARRARQLSWLSLAWMGAEGAIAIAIAAGILAGSIA